MKRNKCKKKIMFCVYILIILCLYYMIKDNYVVLKAKFQGEYNEHIDIPKWQKRNPDVYAWIKVPEVNIDYLILQGQKKREDSYYLYHDIEKEENRYGAIYTERRNSKDFSDYHTIIYGHNMNDGSMFGSLEDFLKEDLFLKNEGIKIFVEEQVLTYKVFAAYTFPDIHLLDAYKMDSAKEFMDYLEIIKASASETGYFDDTVRLDEQSRVITLSTCTSNNDGNRILVQAVLRKGE